MLAYWMALLLIAACAATPPASSPSAPVVPVSAPAPYEVVVQHGHGTKVLDAKLSADGRFMATMALQEGAVLVWEASTGTLLRTVETTPNSSADARALERLVGIAPDGSTVTTVNHRRQWKWDTRTGKALGNVECPCGPLEEFGEKWESMDGHRVADIHSVSGGGKSVAGKPGEKVVLRMFDADTGALVSRRDLPATSDTYGFDVGIDAGLIVSWNANIADVASLTGKGEHSSLVLPSGDIATMKAFRLSADGKQLLLLFADRFVAWDVSTGKETSIGFMTEPFEHGKISRTPKPNLVIITTDTDVRLFDLGRNAVVSSTPLDRRPGAVGFSPDGRTLLVTAPGHAPALWNLCDLSWRALLPVDDGAKPSPDPKTAVNRHLAASFTKGGEVLTVGDDGRETRWDVNGRKRVVQAQTQRPGQIAKKPGVFATSDDGKVALAAGLGSVLLWTAKSTEPTEIAPPSEHRCNQRNCTGTGALSSDGSRALLVFRTTREVNAEHREYEQLGVAVLYDTLLHKVVRTWDEGHITHSASAFSPNGRLLATASGSSIRLVDVLTGDTKATLRGHTAAVHALAISTDLAHVASTSLDGTVRVWNVATGESVTLISAEETWLAIDREGFFDGSVDGGDLVALVSGMRAYKIDQLALRNNRPDKLLERFGVPAGPMNEHFRARYRRRLARFGIRDSEEALAFKDLPEAQIVAVTNSGSTARVELELSSAFDDLVRYQLYWNNVPLLGRSGKTISGRRAKVVENVDLVSAPQRRLEVVVLDRSGRESLRDLRWLDEPELPPTLDQDLYFVGFGVSKYRDSSLDLKFAAKDVQDVGKLLAGMPFRKVYVDTFVDDKATVGSLTAAQALVARARPQDTVVLMVAGHGTHSPDANAEYLFVTHEADRRHIRNTTASLDRIEDLLYATRARRKLLLMDTCESGENDGDGVAVGPAGASARSLRSRGLVLEQSESPVASLVISNRNRMIYDDFQRRTGAVVFSSSRGNEVSYEDERLQNGVFTAELLRAFRTKSADLDDDWLVSDREIRQFVRAGVAKHTGERQHPTVDRDNKELFVLFPRIAR